MALNPNQYATTSAGSISQEEIDAGLRSYMLRTYNYMALGVAATALLVLAMAQNIDFTIQVATSPLRWVLLVALLGMGWLSPKIISMRSTPAAHAFYWAYCAMWGIMISPFVILFTVTPAGTVNMDAMYDVVRAFLITTGMFAGTSLFGYVTKRDLRPLGVFASMAVIGLVIASLVNMFFVESSGFAMMVSYGMVLLFAVITAWETQDIKNMYMSNMGDEAVTRFALFGALRLYGNFIVMFIHILMILRGGGE